MPYWCPTTCLILATPLCSRHICFFCSHVAIGIFRSFTEETQNVNTVTQFDLLSQIMFEVYLASFKIRVRTNNLPLSDEGFQNCFYNYFLELHGEDLGNWLGGFQRSYNLTLRYFRALHAMDKVINLIMEYSLSEQCNVALMKMTHCAHCAGHPKSIKSCNGLCLNTMRGCLAGLLDLVEPIRPFTESLIAMKDKVQTFSPYTQITLLNTYIFSMIDAAGDRSAAAEVNFSIQCSNRYH